MLGTVALLGSDVIAVDVLADGEAWAGARLAAPHVVPELIAELAALPPRHPHRPHREPARAPPRQPLADLAVLVTDGLVEPADLGPALAELAASGAAATLVHVVDAGRAGAARRRRRAARRRDRRADRGRADAGAAARLRGAAGEAAARCASSAPPRRRLPGGPTDVPRWTALRRRPRRGLVSA